MPYDLLQIILSTSCLISLAIYILLSMTSEGKDNLIYAVTMTKHMPIKVRIFFFFASAGLFICLFNGAEAMLYWVPSDWVFVDSDGSIQTMRRSISSLFSVISGFSIIYFFHKANRNVYILERFFISDRADTMIINNSLDIHRLESLKYEYESQINSFKNNFKEKKYFSRNEKLTSLYNDEIKTISYQINKVCEFKELIVEEERNKVKQENNKVKQENNKVKQEKNKVDIENKRIAKEKLLQEKKIVAHRLKTKYLNTISESIRKLSSNMSTVHSCQNFCDLRENEVYLLDNSLVAKIWENLQENANSYLKLDDIKIENGHNTVIINDFFKECHGVELIESVSIEAQYKGDGHGGHTEFIAMTEQGEQGFLSALRFDESLEAIIEGFYIGILLPLLGVFWHGLYGRDYELFLSDQQLIEKFISSLKSSATDEMSEKIDRQSAGVRLIKDSEGYLVSCLAAYPYGGSIVDKAVRITEGKMLVVPEVTIIHSSGGILY